MPDDEMTRLCNLRIYEFAGAERGAMTTEANRARSEEARLLEVVKAKDATIKALADALERITENVRTHYESHPGNHEIIGLTNSDRAAWRAALRLAKVSP